MTFFFSTSQQDLTILYNDRIDKMNGLRQGCQQIYMGTHCVFLDSANTCHFQSCLSLARTHSVLWQSSITQLSRFSFKTTTLSNSVSFSQSHNTVLSVSVCLSFVFGFWFIYSMQYLWEHGCLTANSDVPPECYTPHQQIKTRIQLHFHTKMM